MSDFGLSTQQLEVISALSSGASFDNAAEQAGVHRNTVNYWRRNHRPFEQALADAQYDRALLYREKAEALVEQSFQTIAELLADPNTPASVRLKAALAMIQLATTPPEPKKQIELVVETSPGGADFRVPSQTSETSAAEILHKNAQSVPPQSHRTAPVQSTPAAKPQFVHKNAQTPIRRESPKIGRNESCPCGSGQKYKRCCIDKPQPIAA